MANKYFWIRERHNPQLGVYYIACGQLKISEALLYETNSAYGYNIMHRFKSSGVYQERLTELRSGGERVQGQC